MAKDLMVDENGDLVLDPETHDLAMISGIDEIAQRIKATLMIRYGEMPNIDPDMGTDYSSMLGKHFNKTAATTELTNVIKEKVPEVDSVDEINFEELPNRVLKISFKCTATPTESKNSQTVEGSVDFGRDQ